MARDYGRCDFCCLPAKLRWLYPTDAFTITSAEGAVHSCSPDFAACRACYALIETGDYAALAARVRVVAPTVKQPFGYRVSEWIYTEPGAVDRVLEAFVAHRRGPAVEIEEDRIRAATPAIRAEYIQAIETRLRWLEYVQRVETYNEWRHDYSTAGLFAYITALSSGELFVMVPEFCRLVEHARRTIPDDMQFDARWFIVPSAWLWFSVPFEMAITKAAAEGKIGRMIGLPIEVSRTIRLSVRAVSWVPVQPGSRLRTPDGAVAPPGSYELLCYSDGYYRNGVYETYPAAHRSFTPIAYWLLTDGQRLGERTDTFESLAYSQNDDSMVLEAERWRHEIRLVYTSLYLMAQKLRITVSHPVDRSTRRRVDRMGARVPPYVRVITLRRLEAVRPHDHEPQAVDWQWQWVVGGHWRNQWYPSEGIHKPVYIERYIKGPEDKPLKESGIKLYSASR